MTYEVIDRLVRPANPVPDPRLLEPVDASALKLERREGMSTKESIEVDLVEESSRPGWLMGAAAALVVVIGAVVLLQTTDGSEVASRTPIEIANAYVEAYAAFDVEGVESMLAEGAEVLPWEAYEPRDWKADLRYLEAAGFELIPGECRELPAAADIVRVTCEYEAHGLGSEQIGEGPFGGHTFRLEIIDGLVVYSDMGFNFSEFFGAMWSPFQTWIEENHPDDFSTLYVNPGLSRQTDEAIALWEQRVADYVEYVNNPVPADIANAYVEAYAAFDVEGVESMLAEGAEVLPWESYEPRDWKADLRYLEAAGFELIPGDCQELPGAPEGVRVSCGYEAHGLGSDQIGEGPFGGHTFRLVIVDGLVVYSDMGFNFREFFGAMWSPFQTWIEANHPDDFSTLYVSPDLSRQTDEAIALWEERVADYVEYINNPTATTAAG